MVTTNATTQRVWVELAATPDAASGPVGRMDVVTLAERAVSVEFDYDDRYLARGDAFAVSPELPLGSGVRALGAMPGAFLDASADSWGQKLIRRRLRADGVTMLSEVDALLGVSDEARTGALRFRPGTGLGPLPGGGIGPVPGAGIGPVPGGDGGSVPAGDGGSSVPVALDVRQLRTAAEEVQRGAISEDEAIAALLDAGTAVLGGARPKAFVRRKGRALLAKFPAPDDEHDAIRWEAVCLRLARMAGLATSRVRTIEIGGRAVLLVDRFDRLGRVGGTAVTGIGARGPADAGAAQHGAAQHGAVHAGAAQHGAGDGDPREDTETRIPYWSARTATGDGHDYLDVARAILASGEAGAPRGVVRSQVRDLWRRIAFAVAVHCTDDHLRNLGFLRRDGLWRLCPVFDIEPDPVHERPRSTGIVGVVDPEAAPAALVALAGELRIKTSSWRRTLAQVIEAVDAWPEVARRVGLAEAEFAAMDAAIGRRREALAALLT